MKTKTFILPKNFSKLLLTAAILSTSLPGCGVLEKWSKQWPLAERDDYQYPQEANNIPVDSWAKPPQTQATPAIPNMAPAQGIKTASVAANMNEPLGTEEIRERFHVMEQQIAVMRQDMERIAPLLHRLSMMEESMRELSMALNNAHTNGAMPKMAKPQAPMMHQPQPNMAPPHHTAPNAATHLDHMGKPMATHTLPQTHGNKGGITPSYQAPSPAVMHQPKTDMVAKAPAVQSPAKTMAKKYSGTSVEGIRFGKYKGRDRVVLDLTNKANFRYDLDNNEKLLIVELPNAAWGTHMAKKIKTSDAIAAYTAQPGINGGTQLIFSLKKSARVSQARALPPNSQYGHRIFMDIE